MKKLVEKIISKLNLADNKVPPKAVHCWRAENTKATDPPFQLGTTRLADSRFGLCRFAWRSEEARDI